MTKTRTDKADSMNAARKTSARHANEFDAAVANVLDTLGQVADDDNASRLLHNVFDVVIRCASISGGRITRDQRDQILRRICIVRTELPAIFPYTASRLRMSAARGFDALEALIMWWAEPNARQARRHPHFVLDAVAYARMYRNELDNAALATEVCDRFADRRRASGRSMKIALEIRKMTGTAHGHR